ncbi:MAG: twin-arginine translocase TatA/TatE family subunit [Prolixibacteraceae bacterium]|nr:twin-arginine translocase TatA/TatE family subunit [Prolixibacteraceae bacterium]
MLGGYEIALIVLVIVIILFGGRKIPELMKGIGKGMKEFKNATKNNTKETETEPEPEPENKKEKND